VGVAALLSALGRPVDGAEGARLAEVILLGVLSAGLLAGIADRLAAREAVGMVFILAMVAGHLSMTVALGRDAQVGGFLVAFCCLMLAGDLVKLVFLGRTGFTVRSVPRAAVYGLTGAYALGYAALLVIELAS
jgi:MFS superfamily sulfate permease-like transporter